MSRRKIIIFCLFVALGVLVQGRTGLCEEKERLLKESAFLAGYGSGKIEEGRYHPLLLVVHLGFDLNRYVPEWDGRLSLYLEPQFNPVVEPQGDFEGGIGVGLQLAYPLTDRLLCYVLAGSGPHYISVVTQTQTQGLLFANTAGVGFYFLLSKDSAVSVGYRLRHLSNAGTRFPNGGINNNIGVVGYSFFF
ncbi:MAG: acyloxyacyl hydrolase [Smithellaceae bacterium]|nr:acyloxyacyl hydrolase [Smithellaceae bacterium]